VVNTVLSVPYYFGIIRNMLLEEPTTETVRSKGAGAVRFSVYTLAIATTLFGLLIIPLSALARVSGQL
jgi:NADH:ubiquinone oxidoreductase subunit 2 (subunit N)